MAMISKTLECNIWHKRLSWITQRISLQSAQRHPNYLLHTEPITHCIKASVQTPTVKHISVCAWTMHRSDKTQEWTRCMHNASHLTPSCFLTLLEHLYKITVPCFKVTGVRVGVSLAFRHPWRTDLEFGSEIRQHLASLQELFQARVDRQLRQSGADQLLLLVPGPASPPEVPGSGSPPEMPGSGSPPEMPGSGSPLGVPGPASPPVCGYSINEKLSRLFIKILDLPLPKTNTSTLFCGEGDWMEKNDERTRSRLLGRQPPWHTHLAHLGVFISKYHHS